MDDLLVFHRAKTSSNLTICTLQHGQDEMLLIAENNEAHTALPALATGQNILWEDDMPVANCYWAFLLVEAKKNYFLDTSNLNPHSWESGNNLWFVDWVSPVSRDYTFRLKQLMDQRFRDRVANSIRVKSGSTRGKIVRCSGSSVGPLEVGRRHSAHFSTIVGDQQTLSGKAQKAGL